MTYTDDEVRTMDELVENIFIEEGHTVSFPKKDGIHTFSKTFKLGFSVGIDYNIGEERTKTYWKNKIRKYLDRQAEECIREYKSQALK